MIVQFFNSGTGNSKSAINYLLSEKDSNGTTRNPPPEIFYGDKNLTATLIDNNPNKFKYTSGAIAFRDNEKPTDKQLNKIIKDFYLTFCPGLGPDRVNMFFVKHEDKGNTELHFLVPMLELNTQKQFNISPPGKFNQQLSKDFQSIWNDILGYAQVVEDPLKIIFSQFDRKVPEGERSNKIKERVSQSISKGIRNGSLKSRNDFTNFLESKGCKITRKGKEYISVLFPGDKKAIKFKGPAFSEKANYQELAKSANEKINNTVLDPIEKIKVLTRIETTVKHRLNFNKSRYTPKKRRPSPTKNLVKPRIKVKSAISHKAEISIQPVKEINLPTVKSENPTISTFGKLISGTKGSQNAKSPLSDRKKSSGAVAGVAKSLAGLQVQIDSAHADLANAQTIEERIAAEFKLISLMVQKNKLLDELEQAKIAELNQSQSSRRSRPKP